jgi:ketosteroid isomerase-like protein
MDEEVRKAVEKEKLKYVEGIRRGDAAAMAAFFTEDAILLPPNSEIIRGEKNRGIFKM